MIQALGIFAVTYLLMSKPRWPIAQLDRPTIGLIGAVLMIAAGVLTPAQAYQAIDWNTIVLLLGMFVLSGSLRLAGFFEWAAEVVLTHVHTPIALLTALVFVSGLLSALLVNDTVCVMLAPLVIALIERSDLPMLPYLFALAIGANIGSVMTVVGNPQNMIIAHAAPLSYVEFARVLAPIGVVNLGLTVVILRGIFRQDLQSRTIVLRPQRERRPGSSALHQNWRLSCARGRWLRQRVSARLDRAGRRDPPAPDLRAPASAADGAGGWPPAALLRRALHHHCRSRSRRRPGSRVHLGLAVVPRPGPPRHRPLCLGVRAGVKPRLQRAIRAGGCQLG